MADKLMRTVVVMSFIMIFALFSGCGTNGSSLTDADNGKQIAVRPGEMLSLTLESNPTTGYSWQVLEIDSAVLAQEGDPEYKQSSVAEGLVGAGGTETFRFKTAGSEETTLSLGYMRPWESVQPVETFTTQVEVE
jgi:inhibitor of cysteine peptidase